jgi:hypothetical protein
MSDMFPATDRAIRCRWIASPKYVGFEKQPGACGIEDRLRFDFDPVNFKVSVHNQENVEIPGRRFRSDEAAPNKSSSQLSIRIGKLQEREQANQPDTPG